MDYKLIIFDLGNVLLNYDHRITCRKLSKLTKNKHSTEEIFDFLFKENGLSRLYDGGQITTDEFFKALVDKFGLKINFPEFIPIWNEIFTENKAVGFLVRDFKKRYKVYLISNTNELHFGYLVKKFEILSVFDKMFASYAVKARKPSPEIFKLALKAAQVEPRETIFIDDIKEHVQSAAKLGIRSILFTDVKELKKELGNLGVLN